MRLSGLAKPKIAAAMTANYSQRVERLTIRSVPLTGQPLVVEKGPKTAKPWATRNSGWPWHHRGFCSRHLPRFHAACAALHATAARALESSPGTNKPGQ
jgi:hypothetical protein